MKTKPLLLLLPAMALLTPGCVYDDPYYGSTVSGTVATDNFALTYGTGWMGTGYYWGPPGISYHRHTPGVYYYRTREAVPQHYWRNWHGDPRYGHSSHMHYRTYRY